MYECGQYCALCFFHFFVLFIAVSGCLPAPSAEDLEAIESEDSCYRSSSVRFDTLPIERLPVLHHIELRTADAEATIAFYEEVRGGQKMRGKGRQEVADDRNMQREGVAFAFFFWNLFVSVLLLLFVNSPHSIKNKKRCYCGWCLSALSFGFQILLFFLVHSPGYKE